MKAITLTQPWATLVAIGAKKFETRSWQTSYRGPLAIHAAKGFPRWARELCMAEPFAGALSGLLEDCPPGLLYPLPLGQIVAVCDLTQIYSTNARVLSLSAVDVSFSSEDGWTGGQVSSFQLPPPEPERSFGDYSPNRYAWRLENVQALVQPVPAKGALSLWEWMP